MVAEISPLFILPQYRGKGYAQGSISEAEVVQMVQEIAAETAPFEVCFSHVGIFTGGKVLFIAPDKDTDLIALKEKFGPSFDWTPHTTMLIDESENVQHALPLVMKEFSSFTGKVACLHLYEFWPTRHILTVYF